MDAHASPSNGLATDTLTKKRHAPFGVRSVLKTARWTANRLQEGIAVPLANWKPAKGTALLERKERRRDHRDAEDAHKKIVRLADKRCRYPFCPYCARHKDLILQVAHVVQAKGMSSDRTGERSTADKMMLLCPPIHGLQEKHDVRIYPLTEAGTRGPCEYWRKGENGQMYLVARESEPFQYERD